MTTRTLSYSETQRLTVKVADQLRHHDAGEDIKDYMDIASALVIVFDRFLAQTDLSAEAPGGAFE